MTGPIERALQKSQQTRQRRIELEETRMNEAVAEEVTVVQPPDTPLADQLPNDEQPAKKKRRKVHVSTLGDRYKATHWMIEHVQENGAKHIASKCVKQFPQCFSGSSNANLMKAQRWWKERDTIMGKKIAGKRTGSFSFSTTRRTKRCNMKAMSGRGRKRAEWVEDLYTDLRYDFERLRSVGVKFNTSLLLLHAKKLVSDAPPESSYFNVRMRNGKTVVEHLTIRWIQSFMAANRIVLRSQCGKLSVSPEKQLHIEKSVAFHLGKIKRAFENGDIDEDNIENADETHFVFNMDNGKTLAFIGDKEVKYADVVSGGEPITMMVRLTGGKNASIQPPMIVFKNQSRSYPIRGLQDNVPGVCYRSSPKGWMDYKTWIEWLSEPRAIKKKVNGKKRTLFVDNCSSHVQNDYVTSLLTSINTELEKFPPQATDLVQPADSFVIQKIKDAWRRLWDKYKFEQIQKGNWKNGSNGEGSGFLQNPGKEFFLKLAAESVREVNKQLDDNGMNYARKAMIRCGLSLKPDGTWYETQLSPELQQIIAKHRIHFDGQPVDPADVETETESESESK